MEKLIKIAVDMKIPKETSKKGISEGSSGPQMNGSHGTLCLIGPKEVQVDGDVLKGNARDWIFSDTQKDCGESFGEHFIV